MIHAPRAPFLRNAAYIVVFNTLVAAVLYAIRYGGTFLQDFVHSQCIGLIAWSLCDGGRRLLWPARPAPTGPLLALLAAGTLAGWLGGSRLAAAILQIPWSLRDYASSLVVAAVAMFIAVRYFWERERVARIERQVAESQLRLLQAQIEPHFLFNTLANLRTLIAADPPRAQRMLDHLDGFLRRALAAVRSERNTLAEEFGLLRDYLEILAIRMGPRLRFRLELPAPLAGVALPPMLVQPLVENAVRHGVEPALEGGEIAVTASAAGGRLAIEVSDSGRGLDAPSAGGTGTGLAQIRERLRALYGGEAALELGARPGGGALARLEIPLAAP